MQRNLRGKLLAFTQVVLQFREKYDAIHTTAIINQEARMENKKLAKHPRHETTRSSICPKN
jgi:hypothetical protein